MFIPRIWKSACLLSYSSRGFGRRKKRIASLYSVCKPDGKNKLNEKVPYAVKSPLWEFFAIRAFSRSTAKGPVTGVQVIGVDVTRNERL
jgi:hypothetical protein